jgi:hypothetical protein
MTRKSITTSHAVVACDVCGRTLLRGEHPDAFIAGGARRLVCDLCTARAANEGWIREGMDDGVGLHRSGREGRSLLRRLRGRRDAGDEEHGARRSRRASAEAPAADAPSPSGAVALSAAEPPPEPEPAPVWEPPRHVHAVPTNADLKMTRAVELFNSSSHARTVAGVARSLGPPLVLVQPSSTEGSIVGILAAWELCWYRYEVDLADEAAGVRVVEQGAELSELAPDELVPNAGADERGMLVLAAGG